MGYINDQGVLACTLLSELGLTRGHKSRDFERKFVAGLRDGSSDFIYDDWMLDKIVKVLKPNEIIIVRKMYEENDISSYYKVTLTTYMQQLTYYKRWCVKKKLDERNAVNLRKFVKEVKIIWD